MWFKKIGNKIHSSKIAKVTKNNDRHFERSVCKR